MAKFKESDAVIQKSSLAKEVKENNALLSQYNFARVYIAKGDLATAKSVTEKFWKGVEASRNKNQIRLAHELAGMIAFHEKEYGKAIDELTKANQQDPNVLYHLALATRGTGRRTKQRNTPLRQRGSTPCRS